VIQRPEYNVIRDDNTVHTIYLDEAGAIARRTLVEATITYGERTLAASMALAAERGDWAHWTQLTDVMVRKLRYDPHAEAQL
jgi:hypothetical protein